MRPYAVAACVSICLGLLAGLFFPHAAGANQVVTLTFLPPSDPDYTLTRLTTGWHQGLSLDWDDTVDTTVYARAFGQSNDASATYRAIAFTTTFTPYGECAVVWLDIYDMSARSNPAAWKGSVGYVHAYNPLLNEAPAFFLFTPGSQGQFNGGVPAAQMYPFSQEPQCAGAPYHVHETHHGGGYGGRIANIFYYPSGNLCGAQGCCPDQPQYCQYYWNHDYNNWTRAFYWDDEDAPGLPPITNVIYHPSQPWSALRVSWAFGSPWASAIHLFYWGSCPPTPCGLTPITPDVFSSPFDHFGLQPASVYCYIALAHDHNSGLWSALGAGRCGATGPAP